ncbi:hypothetical protein BJS_07052 [Bradyrhizobium japonicum SEMIA 5079]|nr:hypothetical protein BJS_07052 [Bradyrhizobium japonicum SEMIA 5079]
MQRGYRYVLSAPAGRDFEPQFRPDLTPKQMLELGVICGKYLTDCRDEFPASSCPRSSPFRANRCATHRAPENLGIRPRNRCDEAYLGLANAVAK